MFSDDFIGKHVQEEIHERREHDLHDPSFIKRSKVQQARMIIQLRKKYGLFKRFKKMGMN